MYRQPHSAVRKYLTTGTGTAASALVILGYCAFYVYERIKYKQLTPPSGDRVKNRWEINNQKRFQEQEQAASEDSIQEKSAEK